jgi:hypothetical protein
MAFDQGSCVQSIPQGANDVDVLRFLDEDSRCVISVRGGPSNVDNDQVRVCAKTARAAIGPIK